ncbi:MAG: outer membrane lipoprotein-sorting protein [Acidobacteria bacterium]|nr:outer membrane lipoprotein-sorting protein [Acidobacteriota bacterium]
MKKLLVCLSAVASLAVPASAQTVDEIIAKHVQARGGMDKLKAVTSIRYTGKMTVGPGIEAPVIVEQKRPENMRMELTVQGLTAVQAYDGKTGWMIMPFQGKKDPEPMGGDELKATVEQADFDGPLVDYAAKGNKVELSGKETVEGAESYRLKVTLKSGDFRYIYIDADSFLAIKEESKRMVRGTEMEFESALGDYKDVDGLVLPHAIEGGPKGGQIRQKITIEKVELNPTIDDTRFKMPEVKKSEPKP